MSQQDISIVPKPQLVAIGEDYFLLSEETKIYCDKSAEKIAEYFCDFLDELGIKKEVSTSPPDIKVNKLVFELVDESMIPQKEGYRISVNAGNIFLQALQAEGLFYAVQTLKQLLPCDEFSLTEKKFKIPSVKIYDYPKFQWRGLNLDCCRHFMSKEFVKLYIDLLAFHKMNVLHWHLTEDQAWRIQIKKYPLLTDKGAFRTYDDGSVYGGYYTQDDIKEVIEYAAERFITVVPEIELPGHSVAALSCYPELSCTGGPFEVGTIWGVYKDVYCAGKENTFNFLEDVLAEVIDLFPGTNIHIGGDEVPKDRWKLCLDCQARIKSENLKDEHELQSYFVKRIEKFVNSKGKRIVGWDEILEGGLPPEATVQSWRGLQGAIDAAKQGHDVIVSPTSHCYFDYGIETTDLKKVYSFDPVPVELNADERKHILGGECNMWSEYAPQEKVDNKLFPRILALSEVVWSYPAERNYDEFLSRVKFHYQHLERLGVSYGPEEVPFKINSVYDNQSNSFKVEIEKLQDDIDIYFTTDGSEPEPDSRIQINPFLIDKTSTVKVAAFVNQTNVANSERSFSIHKGISRNVKYTFPYHKNYPSSGNNALVDGLHGTDNFRDGMWQGFNGTDFEAVIDLGSNQSVNKISACFIQATSSWVVFPEYVEYSFSTDGVNYSNNHRVQFPSSMRNPDPTIKNYEKLFDNIEGRFIKVFAKNVDVLPEWHPEAGGKPWIMIDEIVIE
ncbi:MAG: family 20 glycosylhydrolase [Ignavibacteriales bacterium]|nr:MAG: family 20 glycosylhydrolase [Ignavibacteriales bacterium]